MTTRSNEIIKQLNRLANDRNLPPQTRNKMHDAAQHIKNLQEMLDQLVAPPEWWPPTDPEPSTDNG